MRAEKGLDQGPQAFLHAPSKAPPTRVHVQTLRRQRVTASAAHATQKEIVRVPSLVARGGR